jgi:hypothetical protein
VVTGGRDSVTHYETPEPFPSACLLRVHLETGRTHQIRARSLAFRTPRGRAVGRVISPYPDDLAHALEVLSAS